MLVINAKNYAANSFQTNQIGYAGPGRTMSVKDDVVLKQTMPKPTTVFSGVSRSSSKLTRTLTLTGALTPTGEAIAEINVSVPVGAASADVDALLNDMGSYLSSATAKSVVKSQLLNF